MKNRTKLWLVAFCASSFSFVFILFSLVLSNFFQENVFNLNERIVSESPIVFEIYLFFKNNLKQLLGGLEKTHFENFANKIIPWILFVCVISMDIGIKDDSNFKITISSFYSSLKEPHPTRKLSVLYNTIKVLFYISVFMFSYGWYYLDYPMMLMALFSFLILYGKGLLYNRLYKSYKNNNYKS